MTLCLLTSLANWSIAAPVTMAETPPAGVAAEAEEAASRAGRSGTGNDITSIFDSQASSPAAQRRAEQAAMRRSRADAAASANSPPESEEARKLREMREAAAEMVAAPLRETRSVDAGNSPVVIDPPDGPRYTAGPSGSRGRTERDPFFEAIRFVKAVLDEPLAWLVLVLIAIGVLTLSYARRRAE